MSLRFFNRSQANNSGNANSGAANASSGPGPTGNVPMIDFREGALVDTPPVVVLPPDADTVRKLQEMSSRVEEIQRQNEELERKLSIRTKDLEKKISVATAASAAPAPSASSYPYAMMANAAAAAHYNQSKTQKEALVQKINMLQTSALPAMGMGARGEGGTDEDNDRDNAAHSAYDHDHHRRLEAGAAGGRSPALAPSLRKERIDEWMAERVRLEQLRRARDRVMVGGGDGR